MARLFRLQKHLHAHLREYTRDKQKYKETKQKIANLAELSHLIFYLIFSNTIPALKNTHLPKCNLHIHLLTFSEIFVFFFFCQETKDVWACCPLFRCKVDMPVNAVSLSSRSGHWVGDEIMS